MPAIDNIFCASITTIIPGEISWQARRNSGYIGGLRVKSSAIIGLFRSPEYKRKSDFRLAEAFKYSNESVR
jgi:hypothetical protein